MTIKGILLVALALAGAYASKTYMVKDEKEAPKAAKKRDTLQGQWTPVGYTASRFDSLEFRENFIILKLHNQTELDMRRYILNPDEKKIIIDEKLGPDSVLDYDLRGDWLQLRSPGIGRVMEWKRK